MKTSKTRKNSGKRSKTPKGLPSTVPYEEFLYERLQDKEFAAGYLTACLEEGEDVFLLAVRDVARAHGGLKAIAKATKLNRESLYGMLSESGNPLFSSIKTVLEKLGMRLTFEVKTKKKVSRAA